MENKKYGDIFGRKLNVEARRVQTTDKREQLLSNSRLQTNNKNRLASIEHAQKKIAANKLLASQQAVPKKKIKELNYKRKKDEGLKFQQADKKNTNKDMDLISKWLFPKHPNSVNTLDNVKQRIQELIAKEIKLQSRSKQISKNSEGVIKEQERIILGLKERNAVLEIEVKLNQQQSRRFRRAIAQKEEAIEQLKNSKKRPQSQNAKMDGKRRGQQIQMKEMKEKMLGLGKQIEKLENQLYEKLKVIQNYKRQLQKRTIQASLVQKAVEEALMKKQIDFLRRFTFEKNQLNEARKTDETAIKRLNAEKKELIEYKDKYYLEKAKCDSMIDQIEKQKRTKITIKTIDKGSHITVNHQEQNKKEIEERKKQQKIIEKQINQIAKNKTDLLVIKQTLSAVEKQKAKLQQELDRKRSHEKGEESALQRTVQGLRDEIRTIGEGHAAEIAKIKVDLAAKSTTLASKEKELVSLQQELDRKRSHEKGEESALQRTVQGLRDEIRTIGEGHAAKLGQVSSQLSKEKHQRQILAQLNETLNLNVSSKQNQLVKLRNELSTLQQSGRKQLNQMLLFEKDSGSLSTKLAQLNEEKDRIASRGSQIEMQLTNCQHQLQRQRNERKSLAKMNESLSTLSSRLEQELQDLKRDSEKKKDSPKKEQLPARVPQFRSFQRYIRGPLLDQLRDEDRKFVIESIQELFEFRIQSTKFLYRLDQFNKTSFHKYMDGQSRILVIVKTAMGSFCGGYYHGLYSPEANLNDDAIIFSINNRKVFPFTDRNKRSVNYDDFYFILGNAELRLRINQFKVYSNFGCTNGFFAAHGSKTGMLLGEFGTREVAIDGWEAYRLELQ